MNQQELDIVLEKHLKWLKDEKGGERANLNNAILEELTLNDANLNYAQLNYAKLNDAQLNYAQLNGAELNGAELNRAQLNYAELNDAKLNRAELYGANLNYAKLNRAELNYAELNYAQLNGAELNCLVTTPPLLCLQSNRDFSYCFNGIIKIGCQSLPINEWIKKYKAFGIENDYSELEIKIYGKFISMCKEIYHDM